MCGIAAIRDLHGRPVFETDVEAMIAAIRHRGPDHAGTWAGSGVALGNSRLSILDLSDAGNQPMQTDDRALTLVYNGELYNFRELRRELEGAGHTFRGNSDSEVVLHSYAEWGPQCVHRFDGMFAFAVWDNRDETLFAARDRFGVKPLYHAVVNGRLILASEVKSMLAVGLRARVCYEALAEYFTFQNILSDLTLFDGVRLLPAGHTLTVRNGTRKMTRYWDLQLEPDYSLDEPSWVRRVRDAFESSVTRQLVSDVPVGAYLSGGMDSASIVAVASRSIPRLMTFTGGFDLTSVEGLELVFDERRDAETVASTFGSEHYEMVMHAGDMGWVLPELVWHMEDLRLGMAYQNHYITRLASKFVRVALSGAGGDELFGGYPWRYSIVEHLRSPTMFDQAYYGYWSRLVPDAEKSAFFTGESRARIGDHSPFDAYRAVLADNRDLEPLDKALYFETKTFLHGLLIVDDRLSMAHSLEDRVPFLGNELVEVARRIPSNLKYANGTGKSILRAAMAGLLPEEISAKQKQGFSPPDGSWYRGPTMDYIREILLEKRSLDRGYFECDYVVRILDEHVTGRVNHRLLIWSLLCFEWWNRLFIDGEPRSRHLAWHGAAGTHVPLLPR
jgi:asparagine synthase (glutamine-hydrolysing)